LVTFSTLFVMELQSRRVSIVGSTPHPDEAFMLQIARHLTDADDGPLNGQRFLMCDRDRKWGIGVRDVRCSRGADTVHSEALETSAL
jgi:hypothetical protein